MLSRLLTPPGHLASLSPAVGSAAERAFIVEPHTSRGYSSEPPANAYLNVVSGGRRDALSLAFHITYWDRLRWKDACSLQAGRDRYGRYPTGKWSHV